MDLVSVALYEHVLLNMQPDTGINITFLSWARHRHEIARTECDLLNPLVSSSRIITYYGGTVAQRKVVEVTPYVPTVVCDQLNTFCRNPVSHVHGLSVSIKVILRFLRCPT